MNSKLETQNPKSGTQIHKWLVLGLLVLLAGLFLGKNLSGPAFTPATFAHKYYFYGYAVDSLKAQEGRYPGLKQLIGKAGDLYENKDFQALAPILQELRQAQPEDRIFRFYAGLTAHYLKDKEAAIAALVPLAETEGKLQQPARWYAALTYALFNESEEAIQLLKTIEDGPYRDKARELWADLE